MGSPGRPRLRPGCGGPKRANRVPLAAALAAAAAARRIRLEIPQNRCSRKMISSARFHFELSSAERVLATCSSCRQLGCGSPSGLGPVRAGQGQQQCEQIAGRSDNEAHEQIQFEGRRRPAKTGGGWKFLIRLLAALGGPARPPRGRSLSKSTGRLSGSLTDSGRLRVRLAPRAEWPPAELRSGAAPNCLLAREPPARRLCSAGP